MCLENNTRLCNLNCVFNTISWVYLSSFDLVVLKALSLCFKYIKGNSAGSLYMNGDDVRGTAKS